jgi:threonine dehydratase
MTKFTRAVAGAAEALRALFPPTPLQENDYLSRKTGARIFLKREDLTPVRSYKLRGAFNFFRKVADRDIPIFVCASAGNHAQGFAFVCRHFGRKGVVFMPVTTPQQKIDKTRLFGGGFVEIQLVGDFFDACYDAARDFAETSGALMVPPFDHKDIIEGQATVAHEILEQLPEEPRGSITSFCRSGAGGCPPAPCVIWASAGRPRGSSWLSRPAPRACAAALRKDGACGWTASTISSTGRRWPRSGKRISACCATWRPAT